ncbi:hypothetical protein [Thiolapillus sp.]
MADTLEKSIRKRIKVLRAKKKPQKKRKLRLGRNPATGEPMVKEIKDTTNTLIQAGILTTTGRLRSFDIKNH